MKNWGVLIGIVIAVIVIFLFCIFVLPWLYIAVKSTVLAPDPPKPMVTYGEFPFKLVYEMDGEITTIEDTYIIKHEGVGYNAGLGKYNIWDVSYLSQNDGKSFDDVEKSLIILDNDSVRIEFLLGSCEYYMGLEETEPFYKYDANAGDIVLFSAAYTGPISDEELESKYGIKIIEKSISPPITQQKNNAK